VVLLAILVFPYCQVIDAYPGGGGAYAVSRANFGPRGSLLAAAALIVDYTLTVAVSIAAGVASLTSAFPGLSPETVPICRGILAVVTLPFGGLPVLASLVASDDYLPRRFALRDDRQVFGSGIWVLAIMSAVLLIAVGGSTLRLIPLFAIGVFTGFTLAQAGMVVHWRRGRPRGWQQRAAINGLGATATAIATVVFLVTKFTAGAWVVVLAVPALIVLFTRIHRYYQQTGRLLGFGEIPDPPQAKPVLVVVPVAGVSRLTRHALSEALSISAHVIAVTVVPADPDQGTLHTDSVRRQWDRWNPGVPLRVLHTQYASLAGPIVAFIDKLRQQHDQQIIVLIPVVRPGHLRDRLLHNQIDLVLTRALRTRTDVIVTRVSIPLQPRSPA
jgi:hypothetical protein